MEKALKILRAAKEKHSPISIVTDILRYDSVLVFDVDEKDQMVGVQQFLRGGETFVLSFKEIKRIEHSPGLLKEAPTKM